MLILLLREEVATSICGGGLPTGPVRLQCYPRASELVLAKLLPESFELNPKQYAHVIVMVALEGPLFRWNIVPSSNFYKMSSHETPKFKGSVATVSGHRLLFCEWLTCALDSQLLFALPIIGWIAEKTDKQCNPSAYWLCDFH